MDKKEFDAIYNDGAKQAELSFVHPRELLTIIK